MHSLSVSKPILTETDSRMGIIVGITLISLWFVSLIEFLRLDLSTIFPLWIVFGVFLRSFLHTGLFITTHEAIHGAISQNQKVNNGIGYLTSFLYALLPYQVLAKNHRLHHRYPATEKDPDFYTSDSNNFLLWYVNFMKEYQQGRQAWVLLIGMAVIFGGFISLHISIVNIFLFWVIPILISSLQLFTFGIFLPHRQQDQSYNSNNIVNLDDLPSHLSLDNHHRTKSSNYSLFWSFITCYHFGYHWEHHQYPNLPWYKLPQARQKHQNSSQITIQLLKDESKQKKTKNKIVAMKNET
jgi:beta-carotene/zeaxanthin 4-ketolase